MMKRLNKGENMPNRKQM